MQSLLQYRRLRKSVQAQLSQASEKPVRLHLPLSGTQPNQRPAIPLDSTNPEADERSRPHSTFSGIEVRERGQSTSDGKTDLVFVVGWDGPDDPLNPHNWGTPRRVVATILVSLITFSVTATSSIDAAITKQSSEEYHVSLAAGSLTTGMYSLSRGFPFGLRNSG